MAAEADLELRGSSAKILLQAELGVRLLVQIQELKSLQVQHMGVSR